MFADIILPLPLDGVFTYSVPQSLEGQVIRGVRVLVPLGRNKTYVGIISEVHDKKPEGYQTKDILQVLDSCPILLDAQLHLWQWIADYYMAPIGEVFKAAFPAGLKAEDGYRPRTETYIELSQKFRNEAAIHVALNMLQRASKQLTAFIDYLALSGWDKNEPQEITRDELLNQGHSLPTLAALVKRGLLQTYEREVGRLNLGGEPCFENIKPLSQVQQDAFNKIQFSFLKKNVTLLHGVTSAGALSVAGNCADCSNDGTSATGVR